MEDNDNLWVYSLGYPDAKKRHQQYQCEDCKLKMLCLMQTSENEEGPSADNSLTHFGKPTQVWVYIGKHPKQ